MNEAQTNGAYYDFNFTVGDDVTPLANPSTRRHRRRVPVDGRRVDITARRPGTVRLRPTQYASGSSSITVAVSEAGGARRRRSCSSAFPPTRWPVADAGYPTSASGNTGGTISLAASRPLLDGAPEAVDYLYIDGIPAGVDASTGQTYTAPTNNSSVNILG